MAKQFDYEVKTTIRLNMHNPDHVLINNVIQNLDPKIFKSKNQFILDACKFYINEINDLHIDGLPRVDKLNALVGKYVNLEYTLPNGQKVKFLDDQKTYLGNQLESEFGGDRCFGILTSMDFILVCTYEKAGENPELLIYKKR